MRGELQAQVDAVARELQALQVRWETEVHPAMKARIEARAQQAEEARAAAEKRAKAAVKEMRGMAEELKTIR